MYVRLGCVYTATCAGEDIAVGDLLPLLLACGAIHERLHIASRNKNRLRDAYAALMHRYYNSLYANTKTSAVAAA